MPAKDVFHDAVKHALEKEQWIVTDDPLFLRFGGVDMYIDLAAEQLIREETSRLRAAVLSVFLFGGNLRIKPPLHELSLLVIKIKQILSPINRHR